MSSLPAEQPIGRIEILSGQPDEAEAAAIVVAVLALCQPPAPAPVSSEALSPWRQAALREAQQRLPSEASVSAPSLWPG